MHLHFFIAATLVVSVVLSVTLVVSVTAVDEGQCEDLSCASREELLAIIKHMQEERIALNLHKTGTTIKSVLGAQASRDSQDCSICNSNPCLNGGACAADGKEPFHKFICTCPNGFSGPTCAEKISCANNSCGPNTDCFVSDMQINCICKHGYSGNDPKKGGCQQRTISACFNGDPHYTTFDGLRFNYQGTCPYVFSQPCSELSGGYDNFKVVGRNEFWNGHVVSAARDLEVTMFGDKYYIDRKTGNTTVNGMTVYLPYYSPSKENPKVEMSYSSSRYTLKNLVDSVTVIMYTTYGVCLYLPDVPEMRGNQTLCGFAGNVDGNYTNDIVGKDGTVWPITGTFIAQQHILDTWITKDHLPSKFDRHCSTGEQLANNTNCDTTAAVKACYPILEAASSTGPFAKCSPMGGEKIEEYYNNCVYDVCHTFKICNSFTSFARSCMSQVPNTDLGDWRGTTKCPLVCKKNSHYSSCKSSCPATCAETEKPAFCDQPCSEGCICDDGYVIDNTKPNEVTCIRVEECGCSDSNGNSYPANEPWLAENCRVKNECINGTFTNQVFGCSEYADCEKVDSHLECKCRTGFTGNGTHCVDNDECLTSSTCNQDKEHGNCTNTPGSYKCECKPFYDEPDCGCYHPRRHCADLFKYWQINTSGVYTINPPYPFAGKAAFNDHQVYCDMETSGGGWTLMSHDSGSGMAMKTFNDYAGGFGNATEKNVWLGLDIISGMTQEIETSLMLVLERCPRGHIPKKITDCVYPTFNVAGANKNYAVTIPEVCTGTEAEYYDGWARWNLSNTGPQFATIDQDGDLSCSAQFGNTGWWFDSEHRCGSANLNGVRYSCDSLPGNSDLENYLFWSGSPLGDAWLYLRPQAYPDYDSHEVTCKKTEA